MRALWSLVVAAPQLSVLERAQALLNHHDAAEHHHAVEHHDAAEHHHAVEHHGAAEHHHASEHHNAAAHRHAVRHHVQHRHHATEGSSAWARLHQHHRGGLRHGSRRAILDRALAASDAEVPIDYLRTLVSRLSKARDDLSSRREAHTRRFSEDEHELDELNSEREHLQDTDALRTEDAGIASAVTLLKSEQNIYAKNNATDRASEVGAKIEGLEHARTNLANDTADTDGALAESIEHEGKVFFAQAKAEQAEVKLLDDEVKVLSRKLEDEEEAEDGSGGVLEDDEGANDEESARGLEQALGWSESDLDEKASEAEDALHAAVSGKSAMARLFR